MASYGTSMPVMSKLGMLRKKDCEFEISLACMVGREGEEGEKERQRTGDMLFSLLVLNDDDRLGDSNLIQTLDNNLAGYRTSWCTYLLFKFLCICLCAGMCVWVQVLLRPEMSDPSVTEVTGSCELPSLDAGNWTLVPRRAAQALHCWAISPGPQSMYIFRTAVRSSFHLVCVRFYLTLLINFTYLFKKEDLKVRW